MTDTQLVGTIPCTCNGGWVVIACMPDGREIETDAASTNQADLKSWADAVRDRAKKALSPIKYVLVNDKLAEIISLIHFVQRPCSTCGQTGVTMTITAPSIEAIRSANR